MCFSDQAAQGLVLWKEGNTGMFLITSRQEMIMEMPDSRNLFQISFSLQKKPTVKFQVFESGQIQLKLFK